MTMAKIERFMKRAIFKKEIEKQEQRINNAAVIFRIMKEMGTLDESGMRVLDTYVDRSAMKVELYKELQEENEAEIAMLN